MYATVCCKMPVHKDLSLSEKVTIPDRIHAPCAMLNLKDNNLEDDVVQAIVNERSCAGNDDLDNDSDQEQTVEPTVTHIAARLAVQVLEHYFMEQEFNELLPQPLTLAPMQ